MDQIPFEPSAERARGFDVRMRSRLADSLDHVVEQSRGKITFDEASLARVTAGLRRGQRCSPDTFALYYDLVDALLADDPAPAEALFAELAGSPPPDQQLTIAAFAPSSLGPPTFNRYRRMMDTDPLAPYIFTEPPADMAAIRAAAVERAVALMEKASPELAGEFRALVLQILLATGGSASGDSQFDGGSSFMLWGALFLNPARPKTDIELIESLAHESAHSLLFGFAIDDALVENPDDERFESPLRDDPRPMDGIFHATFVSARMHYAMATMAASGLLSEEEAALARAAMERDRRAFYDGLATVDAKGRLTRRGKALIAGARDYMAGAT